MLEKILPVLNTDTNRIVMLPLANKVVIKQGSIIHHLSCNVPAIDDESYQALIEPLGIVAVNDDQFTCDYFVNRCLDFKCEDKPVVSRKGYEIAFGILSKTMNIKSMLEDLKNIILDWYEEDTAKVLARIGYPSPFSDDDTELSIDIIKSANMTDAIVTSYKEDDKTMILWKE